MDDMGFIILHRKVLDNPTVCKDAEHLAVWMYLLLNATHKEVDAVFGGERITLKKGQLITGRKAISQKLLINESKVTRILISFKNEQQIEQQTSNKNRLITVINWELYQNKKQQNERQVNNNRTTSEQQVNTNNNDNNDNNETIKKRIAPHLLFGEYKNVKLTETEYENLGPKRKEYVDFLDAYIEEKGYKSKNHNLAIRRWVIDACAKKPTTPPKKTSFFEMLQEEEK